MSVPTPTYIYRLIHLDNLSIYLARGGIHAPNFTPSDGLAYRTIHNINIQSQRQIKPVPCGPTGVIHDYVPFYFCNRSPMLYQLHRGGVQDYDQGQEPLIHLVSSAQAVLQSKIGFVFSDGHGIAYFTEWFCSLADLVKLDWEIINARYWTDTPEDMDRKRRKQAEFLAHRFLPWNLVLGIGVINDKVVNKVKAVFAQFPSEMRKKVKAIPGWYY